MAAGTEPIVLLAHGSPDPRHQRDVEALAERVRTRSGGRIVRTAYLDHHGPTPTDTGRLLTGSAEIVAVPTLLTRAFHVRVDIPAAGQALGDAAGAPVRVTSALGPDRLLGDALMSLIRAADPQPEAVVVYLAGSSQHEAVDDLVNAVRAGMPAGRAVAFATLDDYLPLDQAIAGLGAAGRHTAGVSCMIAAGILRDRMVQRCAAAGVGFVDGVLADTEELARLVLLRAGESLSDARG